MWNKNKSTNNNGCSLISPLLRNYLYYYYYFSLHPSCHGSETSLYLPLPWTGFQTVTKIPHAINSNYIIIGTRYLLPRVVTESDRHSFVWPYITHHLQHKKLFDINIFMHLLWEESLTGWWISSLAICVQSPPLLPPLPWHTFPQFTTIIMQYN